MYLPKRLGLITLLLFCTMANPGIDEGQSQSANMSKGQQQTAAQEARLEQRDQLKEGAKQLAAGDKASEAVAAMQQAIAIERDIFGTVSNEVASSLEDLATIQVQQDDFAAAIKSRQEALSIQKQLHAKDHWKVNDAQRDLAETERFAKLDNDKRQLVVKEAQLDSKSERLFNTGRFDEALTLVNQALEIDKEIFGEKDPSYAGTLNSLAMIYQMRRDFGRAESLYRQALDILKGTVGEKHQDYLLGLNNLLRCISACDTGLGETAGGEGLLGLQRAFQTAGVHSVVASLWKIRDDAARSLMADFYQNLWKKGMTKIEALRAAQLTMLKEGISRGVTPANTIRESRRLPPEYWAAFVLSGNWR